MRTRPGFSMMELLVAIIVMGLVMAGAMNFFIGQSKTFRRGSSDVTLLQNVRFAADLLNQHFRSVGANTSVGQEPILYVSNGVFSFNADYATRTPGDLDAIYYTPHAPDGEVQALPAASAFTIPGTSLTYPAVDYEEAPGIMSPAETITFWFAPDTETARTDDYVLFRQVNNGTAEAVVRNILPDSGGAPFFRFMYLKTDPSTGAQSIDTVPDAMLPLSYDKDTVLSLHQLRAVQVSFMVTNGLSGTAERIRPFSLVAPFPNMAVREIATCGNPPLTQATPVAALNVADSTINVTWTANADETGGERDIKDYVVWRRLAGDSLWHDPFATIPAGAPPNYLFNDANVQHGNTYEYAVAAEDCTPSFNDPVKSNQVLVP